MRWNGNVIALKCSFDAQPFKVLKTDVNVCGTECNKELNCTHFSFVNKKCELNSGVVKRLDAKHSIDRQAGYCGFATVKSKSST